MAQRKSQNIPPLNLNSLPLWLLKFEQQCKANGLSEEDQFVLLVEQIPDFLQNKVLNITRESFSDGSYKRLKDALIDAVNGRASDEVDFSDSMGVFNLRGQSAELNANDIRVTTPAGAQAGMQGYIGVRDGAKLDAKGDIVLSLGGGQQASAGNDTPDNQ